MLFLRSCKRTSAPSRSAKARTIARPRPLPSRPPRRGMSPSRRPRRRWQNMSGWLHNLPVLWMALVVFGATYLTSAIIHSIVMFRAVGERAIAFKAVSPGMLPQLGILFGPFVAFTAAQI